MHPGARRSSGDSVPWFRSLAPSPLGRRGAGGVVNLSQIQGAGRCPVVATVAAGGWCPPTEPKAQPPQQVSALGTQTQAGAGSRPRGLPSARSPQAQPWGGGRCLLGTGTDPRPSPRTPHPSPGHQPPATQARSPRTTKPPSCDLKTNAWRSEPRSRRRARVGTGSGGRRPCGQHRGLGHCGRAGAREDRDPPPPTHRGPAPGPRAPAPPRRSLTIMFPCIFAVLIMAFSFMMPRV